VDGSCKHGSEDNVGTKNISLNAKNMKERSYILSLVWRMSIDGFQIDDRIYCTARDCTLQFTATHTHSSVHSHVRIAVA
jgi:hypothetical protein